jgi:tetrahydromethanopterin:alpha-L-glutamate ligase
LDRRIPIFTDDPGWHGRRLQQALAIHGYEAVYVSLKDCHLDLTQGSVGVVIPGFEDGLPGGVFVRGVPHGTLQQVIARLDILHALQMLGVTVYNHGRGIERTVDKSMTSLLLHLNDIPTPETWICESRQQAQSRILKETMAGHMLVIKPMFGSQGKGVRRLDSNSPLPLPMEEHVDGLYYLQRFIDSGAGAWHDHRVFVIADKAVGAMKRCGNGWISNVAQGASCEFLSINSDIAELAVAAARAVDIDYCGVDIIRDCEDRLYVLEINGIPAWKGLQSVIETDIAQALVNDFVAKIDMNHRQPALAVAS